MLPKTGISNQILDDVYFHFKMAPSGKIETTCYSVALLLGYISLKEEQTEVIATFVTGTNAIRCHFKFSVVMTQEIKIYLHSNYTDTPAMRDIPDLFILAVAIDTNLLVALKATKSLLTPIISRDLYGVSI